MAAVAGRLLPMACVANVVWVGHRDAELLGIDTETGMGGIPDLRSVAKIRDWWEDWRRAWDLGGPGFYGGGVGNLFRRAGAYGAQPCELAADGHGGLVSGDCVVAGEAHLDCLLSRVCTECSGEEAHADRANTEGILVLPR